MDLQKRVEEVHLEALDTVLAINEITEWKVATTNSVKILGVLISRQDSLIKELTTREVRLVEAIQTTINNNLHLADGDDCTLINLTRVLKELGIKEEENDAGE